jgi:excinuclease UvrABC nuclease subunit
MQNALTSVAERQCPTYHFGVAESAFSISDSVAAALPEVRSWPARPTLGDLEALPSGPAVYLLANADCVPVLLATTQSLRRVLVSRLGPEAHRPRKADLAEVTRNLRWRALATAFEGRWWYYRLARELYPQRYRRMVSFGPAWFLNVDWDAPVPEIRVSNQVWCAGGQFVGPWPSQHSARETLEGLVDLFDLCRDPDQLRRVPRGTRCAYAELGRCDAPCDGSAPLPAYAERCRAAWRFACGGYDEWIGQATGRMKQAAAVQKYELAALLRQQVLFAEAWRDHWSPKVQPAEHMRYLLGLRATRRQAVKLFLFRAGDLTDGPLLPARRVTSEAAAWLRGALARTPDLPAVVRMEQTWLFSHFLYGSELDSALLMRVPGADVPADLENQVQSWTAHLSARLKSAPNSQS